MNLLLRQNSSLLVPHGRSKRDSEKKGYMQSSVIRLKILELPCYFNFVVVIIGIPDSQMSSVLTAMFSLWHRNNFFDSICIIEELTYFNLKLNRFSH